MPPDSEAEDPPGLPPFTRVQSLEISRRRRTRNWAMLIVLLALCGLFYAISIVKLAGH